MPGLMNCGRSPIKGAQNVALTLWDLPNGVKFAGTTNTQVCKNPLCLTCSIVKDRKHREQLEIYIAAHHESGGAIYAFRTALAGTFQRTGQFYSQERAFLKSAEYSYYETALAEEIDTFTRDDAFELFKRNHPKPDSWTTWGFKQHLDAFKQVKSMTVGGAGGSTWGDVRKDFGIVAITSNLEVRVTPSENGEGRNAFGRNWRSVRPHPHSVTLMFTESELPAADVRKLSEHLKTRFVSAARDCGWKATKSGQHFAQLDASTAESRARIAAYQHKGAVQQQQVARGHTTPDTTGTEAHAIALSAFPTDKLSARVEVDRISYDPYQALADAMPYTDASGTVHSGDPHALTFWHNYENTMKNVRTVNWTPTARKKHSVQEKQEQLEKQRKAGRTSTTVALVPVGQDFDKLKAQKELIPHLLNLAENSEHPVEAVNAVLAEESIDNVLTDPATGTALPRVYSSLKANLLHQSSIKSRLR